MPSSLVLMNIISSSCTCPLAFNWDRCVNWWSLIHLGQPLIENGHFFLRRSLGIFPSTISYLYQFLIAIGIIKQKSLFLQV